MTSMRHISRPKSLELAALFLLWPRMDRRSMLHPLQSTSFRLWHDGDSLPPPVARFSRETGIAVVPSRCLVKNTRPKLDGAKLDRLVQSQRPSFAIGIVSSHVMSVEDELWRFEFIPSHTPHGLLIVPMSWHSWFLHPLHLDARRGLSICHWRTT